MSEQIFVFVGIKQCGCTLVAWPDLPEYEKQNADAIDGWQRARMTVARIEAERAREEKCAEHRAVRS